MPSIHSPIFRGSVLFKFSLDEKWLHFRVRSRRNKYAHSFYCSYDAFMQWLNEGDRTYLEMDCGHLLKANLFNGQLILEFYWLSRFSDSKLQGQVDTIYMLKNELISALKEKHEGVILSYDHRLDKPARFDFTHAGRTLRSVLLSPNKRRALSKLLAVRNGGYTNDVMKVYSEGQHDFYFINTMSNGRSYNGGIILHEGKSADGHPCVYYSIHT